METDLIYLVQAAQAGNRDAMQLLLDRHAGLIKNVARRFRHPEAPREVREDLEQDARLAFMRMVHAFRQEPEAFPALVTAAMSNHCQLSVNQYARPDTVGYEGRQRMVRLLRAGRRYEARHGRPATLTEMSDLTGIPHPEVIRLLRRPVRVEYEAVGLADDHQAAMDQFFRAFLIDGLVRNLPEKEEEVVLSFYGLAGRTPVSQEQIAARFSVDPSTARRWHRSALARMREQIGAEVLI